MRGRVVGLNAALILLGASSAEDARVVTATEERVRVGTPSLTRTCWASSSVAQDVAHFHGRLKRACDRHDPRRGGLMTASRRNHHCRHVLFCRYQSQRAGVADDTAVRAAPSSPPAVCSRRAATTSPSSSRQMRTSWCGRTAASNAGWAGFTLTGKTTKKSRRRISRLWRTLSERLRLRTCRWWRSGATTPSPRRTRRE